MVVMNINDVDVEQVDIFDILEDVETVDFCSMYPSILPSIEAAEKELELIPDPKFSIGGNAKIRKPNNDDDIETFAILDKHKNDRIVVTGKYWNGKVWGYYCSIPTHNVSVAFYETDLL